MCTEDIGIWGVLIPILESMHGLWDLWLEKQWSFGNLNLHSGISLKSVRSIPRVLPKFIVKGLFTHLVQDKCDLCISCLYELQTWITFLCSLSPRSLYSLSVCQCLKMYLLNITKPVSTYICDCKPPEDLCTCLRELWLGRGGGGVPLFYE